MYEIIYFTFKFTRVMAWPYGTKKVGWIDMQDVVLAICAILVDVAPHKNQTYTITGIVDLYYKTE